MAIYTLITDGSGSVIHDATGIFIPNDAQNADWIRYQAWVALGNTADPESRTLAEAQAQARGRIHAEGEVELARWSEAATGRPMAAMNFERLRAESVAATIEGSPWAAGYPFLEPQVGIHGADVGAVATYWTAAWGLYEANAAMIEATRETALADVSAASTPAEADTVMDGLTWPNQLEMAAAVLTLTAPAQTLTLPVPSQRINHSPAVVSLDAFPHVIGIRLRPDPAVLVLAAPSAPASVA
jgi:hypothetical protein